MGFPDWQRITQWLGSPLLSWQDITLDGSGGHSLVTEKYNTSYRGILVSVLAGNNDVWLKVEGEQSNPYPVSPFPMQAKDIWIGAGKKFVAAFDAPLPIQTVTLHDGTAGDNVTVAVYPTNLNAGCYYTNPALYFADPTASLAVSAHVQATLDPYFGPARLTLDTYGGQRFLCEVWTEDSAGTVTAYPVRLRQLGDVADNYAFSLLPGKNVLFYENTGTAAADAYISLVGTYDF